MTLSGPRPAVWVQQEGGHVVHGGCVDGLDAVAAGHGQPLGHEIHAEHAVRAHRFRAARGELPDRAEPIHGYGPTRRDVRVAGGLPPGGQDVRQVQEAVIRRSLGHLDRPELGLRNAQELGLATRDLAVQLGVAEEGGTVALVPVLGGLALGEQLPLAHPAVPARDVERDHHPVAGRDVAGGLRADLLDHAHGLVAQDVPGLHERAEHLVQVQVRPADVGACDPRDRVVRFLDRRIGNLLDPDVTLAVPRNRLHSRLLRAGEPRPVRQATRETWAPARPANARVAASAATSCPARHPSGRRPGPCGRTPRAPSHRSARRPG
jgi:hypothetical protein